jgi:hypothetical protein
MDYEVHFDRGVTFGNHGIVMNNNVLIVEATNIIDYGTSFSTPTECGITALRRWEENNIYFENNNDFVL